MFGYEVPKKYIDQVISFCDNNSIQYSHATREGFLFSKKEDRDEVVKWVQRLKKLDQE